MVSADGVVCGFGLIGARGGSFFAVEGFGVSIIANGFKPNRTVDWQIVNSKGDVPLFGYFNSNMSGGFNETTYADDLTKGRYKMYFGTDSNNDNIMDTNVTRIYANLTVPCEDK